MTIRLQQVIQAIEEADDVFTSFWDTKTGETVYLADSLMTGEMDETFAAEIENAPERYIRFPSKHEIHQYRIMEDFIDQFSPGKAQEELAYTIRGKGAFRRFKQSVRYHGLEQRWYDYLAETYRELAIRWCAEKGLEYVDGSMVERYNRVIAVYDGREKGGTVGTIRLVHTTKVSTVISPEITHSFNTVADGASEPMPAENIQNYLDARHQLSADWSSQPQVMRKAIEIAVEWDFRQVNGFSITKDELEHRRMATLSLILSWNL